MLVALNKEQTLINVLHYSRKELVRLRKEMMFYCLACQEPLILKIGSVKQPHFAHLGTSNCAEQVSEREGVEHLQGKEQLFHHFKKIADEIELEPFLAPIKQRPDVLVTVKNERFAIEFQCSSVEIARIQERTHNYLQLQIHPAWILRTPSKMTCNAPSLMKIQLSKFQQAFINQTSTSSYLITYSPDRRYFYYATSLFYLYGNSYLTLLYPLSLQQQSIPLLKPIPLSNAQFFEMMQLYNRIKKQFVLQRIYRSKKGVNDLLLRALYELNISRDQVPNFIGVPTKYVAYIPLFSVEWQSALFQFCMERNKWVTELEEGEVTYFLEKIQVLPTERCKEAVLTYIKFIEHLEIRDLHAFVEERIIIEQLYLHIVALWCEN